MDADPRMFALSVALAAATGFVSPYSHPGNILVMGPASYRFSDHAKAGSVIAISILAALFGMLVAVMRKLLLQLNAIAQRGTPWLDQYPSAA